MNVVINCFPHVDFVMQALIVSSHQSPSYLCFPPDFFRSSRRDCCIAGRLRRFFSYSRRFCFSDLFFQPYPEPPHVHLSLPFLCFSADPFSSAHGSAHPGANPYNSRPQQCQNTWRKSLKPFALSAHNAELLPLSFYG